MRDKQVVVFTTKVTEQDWDEELGGWRCPALKIPGALVESVFVSGKGIDSSWYQVDYDLNVIRWGRSEDPPFQAVLSIRLTEELSTKELTLKWKKLAIILPFVASVVVALIAGWFSYKTKPGSPPLSQDCAQDVKIVFPTNNATVSIPVTVSGTNNDLPEGQKIYVLVNPAELGRYYPQMNAVMEQSDQTWISEIYVGRDYDIGKIFLIHAVLADKMAQNELNIYINRVKETNDSTGLTELPRGTRICSTVKVVRR